MLYYLYDIFSQQTFNALNNQFIPTNITNFNFSNTEYFTAWITVSILSTNGNLFSGFTLDGILLNTKWQINSKFIQNGKEAPIKIISPHHASQRGCQLSFIIVKEGKNLFNKLTAQGVISDWRQPDVLRVAPVPLYNTFQDVFRFGQLLEGSLSS